MYSIHVAYFLWFLSGFGCFGFHRFYLGKIPTGILWIFTGGGFLVGTIYDFFTLRGQVQEANFRKAMFRQTRAEPESPEQRKPFRPAGTPDWRYAEDVQVHFVQKNHLERTILKLAKANKGILTVSEVALSAEISIDETKQYLEALVSKGFAELRVRKSGSIVYVIPDIVDKDEPLEDF